MKTPKQIAGTYKECLEAVKEVIPKDILGKGMEFSAEDYRTMASNSKRRGGGGNGGNYQGPASDKQIGYAKSLIKSGGTDAADLVESFLEVNGLDSLDKITKSHATTLIDQLKTISMDQESNKVQ